MIIGSSDGKGGVRSQGILARPPVTPITWRTATERDVKIHNFFVTEVIFKNVTFWAIPRPEQFGPTGCFIRYKVVVKSHPLKLH